MGSASKSKPKHEMIKEGQANKENTGRGRRNNGKDWKEDQVRKVAGGKVLESLSIIPLPWCRANERAVKGDTVLQLKDQSMINETETTDNRSCKL